MKRVLLSLFLSASSLLANTSGTLMWDTTSGDGAAISHGSGTWNATNALWNSGSGNITWPNSTPRTNAVFIGNTSGVTTITIGSDALQLGTMTVNGAGGTMVLNGTYANLNANLLEVKTSAAGKLAINATGTLANVAALSIDDGASIYISAATMNTAVSVRGAGNSENLGAIRLDNNATLQGTLNLLADSTFGSNAGTGIISATISGAVAFNRSSAGNGTIRITGNNSHTGGSTLSRAVVQAGNNHAFGSGLLQLQGGTLSADSTTARTFANDVSLGTAITLGNATQSGRLTFSGITTANVATTMTAASAVEFAEIRAAATVRRAGAGSFTLSRLTALSNAAALTGETITLPAGGAVIDTAGFDVVISARLTGGPLRKIGTGTLTLDQIAPEVAGNITIEQGIVLIKGAITLPSSLKIMPLGDSITVGGSIAGYRLPLYQHLLPIAPGFSYAGDTNTSPSTLPAGFQNHSGRSSYSTDDIRQNLDGLDFTTFNTYGDTSRDPRGGNWLTGLASALTYTVPNRGTFTYGPRAAISPDIILLLVGANDVNRLNATNGDHRANYTALLNRIYVLRPNVHVFAAKLTPHVTNNSATIAFNTIIEQVVAEFQSAGKAISLVDLHTGYTGGLPDNIHPDAAGYSWMAGKWRDALMNRLGAESAMSLRTAPRVQVAAGATLSGNAIIAELALGGTLTPGADQIGSVTASSATLSGTYQCQIRGALSDRLIVEGNLDLTGSTLALSIQAPVGRAAVIASYGGTCTGNFNNITGLLAGYEMQHDVVRKQWLIGRAYDVWRVMQNLPELAIGAESNTDADKDGVNDLLEFIGGTDPGNPSSHPQFATRMDGILSGAGALVSVYTLPSGISFAYAGDGALTGSARGVTLRVEGSRNLTQWRETVTMASPWGGLPTAPAGMEHRAFSIAVDGSSGFIRITATIAAP